LAGDAASDLLRLPLGRQTGCLCHPHAIEAVPGLHFLGATARSFGPVTGSSLTVPAMTQSIQHGFASNGGDSK
jgi:hypothetical protein